MGACNVKSSVFVAVRTGATLRSFSRLSSRHQNAREMPGAYGLRPATASTGGEPRLAGKAKAVGSGIELRERVAELGRSLGLEAETEVSVGRRVWGAKRRIDVVLRHPETRRSLGIECKYQGTQGSAEEKIAGTIEDIRAWPIRGIVVFSGDGFSDNMRAYLVSTGMAVELSDVKTWLHLYFGL